MNCSPAIKENRVTTVQCLSGTGSLRVGGEFLARHYHEVSRRFSLISVSKRCTIVRHVDIYFLISILPENDIHSAANMGKSSKDFHFSRLVCEDLSLL